jgi:tripartite-type tricarboxylate transporter receptor subunit TctC
VKLSFHIMRTVAAALLAGALSAPLSAAAQDFPSKPITIVIPFGPGGSNDTYGRVLAEKLGKLWSQTVIVENRPGAGSAIGAAHVAQARPDGHTLLFVSTSFTTTAATQVKLPFDPLKDLQPVAQMATGDLFLLTGKRVPIKTIEDLQKVGKAQTLFGGAPGIGSISHLAGLMVNDALGIKTEFVQHTSGANVMTDIGGGRIDTYYGVVFEATSGITTPVAVLSEQRSTALPDVPTVAEAGFPNALAGLWWGVFAPAGTPKEITDKINKDIRTVMKAPDTADFLKSQGLRVSELSPQEFADHVKNALERWTAVSVKHGLRK